MLLSFLQQSPPTHSITIPAETPDVESAIHLAARAFGEATINPGTIYDSYRKNPYCHVIVKDNRNNVLGYTDFFLLRPETFDAFLAGEITENHIVSADILPYGDPSAGNRIYLGGIVVFSDSASERGRIVQMLLNGFARLMLARYVTQENPIDAYAAGFSGQGLALLERLGFGCVGEGSQRKDGQPLYHYHMTKPAVEYLAQQTLRAERNCRLEILDRL